jgi:MFS family permease
MRKLLNLLRSRPLFTRVLLALTVSGLGTAFTAVAVYQKLTELDWGPAGFGLAFAAGLLPGMLTSVWSGRHSARWPIGKILIAGQAAGLCALILPLWGSISGQMYWLLAAEVMASAVGGILVPVFKGLERASFAEDEFPTVASLDTFLLTANFVFGQGLGSLLVSSLSLRQFLSIDALSYVIALILLWPLSRQLGAVSHEDQNDTAPMSWRFLKPEQKRALMVLIWLPLVTVPLMVTLPARGAEFGSSFRILNLVAITPALFLICGRTTGQILGPPLAVVLNMPKLAQQRWSLSLALFVYILSYALAFHVSSLYTAVALCLLAHIASNVVYAVGSYQMMTAFSAQEIGWAAAFTYRTATFAMGVIALSAGLVAANWGWASVISFSIVMWIMGSFLRRTNVAHA